MRVSQNITGGASIPRISIFRSNKYIYAQAIDDVSEKTIVSVHTKEFETKGNFKKSEASFEAGKKLAELLKSKKVNKAIVDRNRFHYQGRLEMLVKGVREGGIEI